MKLFVLGAPCSGKSTAVALLRRHAPGVNPIDVDDEVVPLNGGTWPAIEEKNERFLPMVLEAAAAPAHLAMWPSGRDPRRLPARITPRSDASERGIESAEQ